ncbi:MAG: acyl carrier protein [Candidatus Sulfotelmatobacter sp.]
MVFEQIRRIASDLFAIPVERITACSSPESIEAWDSIQHLNLILAVEERFNLQLTPEETEQMTNIGEIAKIVDRRLSATPS